MTLLLCCLVWLTVPAAHGAVAGGGAAAAKITPALTALMARSGPDAIPVIVRFNRGLANLDWAELEQRTGGKMVATHQFDAINGVALRLPAPQVRALSALPQVAFIEEDDVLHITLSGATQWFGARHARTSFALDGAGVTIAIIDTGIDAGHVDLSGKVVGWRDFVNGRPNPYDDHSHGTHVAGIAAGAGVANAQNAGVAPGANLVGLKVCDSGGSCLRSNSIAAVQWVIDNKDTYNIRVMNLSLGNSSSSDGTDSLSTIINTAADHGIVGVVSAGNAGPGARTIGSPAAAAKAITVGAMRDVAKDGFGMAGFSSRGPTLDGRIKPDIVAPGWAIVAPAANSGTGYTTKSGTSMSSPFAAGVAALMVQANPALTPAQVKSAMMSTAHDWGPPGPDIDYGSGRLDAYLAVEAVRGQGPGNMALPVHLAYSGTLSGPGDRVSFFIDVTNKSYPIAATLIMPDWTGSSSPDFMVEIRDPSGKLLRATTEIVRQDFAGVKITATGTYEVSVVSKAGAGRYQLDISAGASGSAEPPPPPPPPAAPPEMSILTPADSSTLSGVVTVSAQASAEAGVASVAWALNGGSYQAMSSGGDGTWQASWNTAGAPNGAHTVTIRVTDTAGQSATASVGVQVENRPADWSSGNLEKGNWNLSGPGDFSRDYSFSPPAYQPVSMTVTINVKSYQADGSDATDGIPPYLEVWTVVGGADHQLVGRVDPAGAGTFTVTSIDPAVLAGAAGGQLRLYSFSLDRVNGKVNDKLAVDQFVVELQY